MVQAPSITTTVADGLSGQYVRITTAHRGAAETAALRDFFVALGSSAAGDQREVVAHVRFCSDCRHDDAQQRNDARP